MTPEKINKFRIKLKELISIEQKLKDELKPIRAEIREVKAEMAEEILNNGS